MAFRSKKGALTGWGSVQISSVGALFVVSQYDGENDHHHNGFFNPQWIVHGSSWFNMFNTHDSESWIMDPWLRCVARLPVGGANNIPTYGGSQPLNHVC